MFRYVHPLSLPIVLLACLTSALIPSAAMAHDPGMPIPVQMPYQPPPKPEAVPDTSIPPANKPLGPDEIKRAEALLPLLEGKQEFWAMGEFVHLGPPAVPVLVKGLAMPGARA